MAISLLVFYFVTPCFPQWNFEHELKARDANSSAPVNSTPIPQLIPVPLTQGALKEKLRAIPSLDLVSAGAQSSNRVQRLTHSGVKEAAPVMSWGPLVMRSDLSNRSQTEMIPLNDFENVTLDTRGSVAGPSGKLALGRLQKRAQMSSSVNDQGAIGLRVASGDWGGGTTVANISHIKNTKRFYNPQTDHWTNLSHDDEDFVSLNSEIALDDDTVVSVFHSRLSQEVPGEVFQNFQHISENKDLTMIGASRELEQFDSLWKGEFAYKNLGTDLEDPQLESQRLGRAYKQREQILGLTMSARKNIFEHADFKVKILGESGELLTMKDFAQKKYHRKKWGLAPEFSYRFINLNLEASQLEQDQEGQVALSMSPQIWSGLYWDVMASQTWRVPSLISLYGNDSLYEGNPDLKNEKFLMFKSGLRWDSEGLTLQSLLFHQRPENLIVTRPSSFATWKAQNVGRAWITGLESMAKMSARTWPVGVQASVVYQEALNSSDGPYFGQDLPLQPRLRGKWRFEKPIGDYVTTWISGDIFSSFNLDEGARLKMPGANQENIGLDLVIYKIKISLSCQNILDKKTAMIEGQDLIGNHRRQLMGPDGEFFLARSFQSEVTYVF